MRIPANILLTILFVPLFLIGVVVCTTKFQLLNPSFWLSTFEGNNIYPKLATVIMDSAENKVRREGGSINDAKVLTNLISPANLKDLFSKNMVSLLDYMNGKKLNLDVYLPIDKLPKDLLPVGVAERSDTVPIETLLSEFNIKGVDRNRIWLLGTTGLWLSRIMVLDFAIMFLIVLSFYFLTKAAERFWNLGAAFVFSGIITLGAVLFLAVVRGSMITDWPQSAEPFQKVFSIFLPYLVQNVLNVWLVVGISSVAIGMALFFLKKGVYNNPKPTSK